MRISDWSSDVCSSDLQRLHQRHLHPLRQAADIVMALDRHRRAAGEAHAFDNIRIERALSEEIGPADPARFLVEHVNEGLADELALGLGIGKPLKPVKSPPSRLPMAPRDAEMRAEQADRKR